MIIRTILIVAGISIASSCSVSSSRYAAKPSVNPASIVQINRHLEIPSRKARVYIQNGVETTLRNIDKFSTYCSVLMQNVHSSGEPLLTVSPGHFEIIKVRKSNDSLYFPEWTEVSQIREFADQVRDRTAGIPVGYKLSAQHIEKDIDAALDVGVDYIILDGRGIG